MFQHFPGTCKHAICAGDDAGHKSWQPVPKPLPATESSLCFATVWVVWWKYYFRFVPRKDSSNFGQKAMLSAWNWKNCGAKLLPLHCCFIELWKWVFCWLVDVHWWELVEADHLCSIKQNSSDVKEDRLIWSSG